MGASSGTGRKSKRKPSGRRKPDGVTQLITADQVEKIRKLRDELGGDWAADRYFAGACRKRFGKDRPATAGEGSQVIEMLKQRIRYDASRRAARD